MLDAKEMMNRQCPFIRRNCMGPECVMWMGKDVVIESNSGVWTDGVMVKRGKSKCRLWVDECEYMR